jgi:hypothetical protein
MKTFVKNYIGKGKQVAELQIVKVTCKLDDLEKFAYEYDGIRYVTFEVAKMKNKDSFGRDHTCYVNHREETGDTVKKDVETKNIPVSTPPVIPEEEMEEIPF